MVQRNLSVYPPRWSPANRVVVLYVVQPGQVLEPVKEPDSIVGRAMRTSREEDSVSKMLHAG